MRDCGDCIACCVFLKPNSEPGIIELERCRHAAHEGAFSYTGSNACGNCMIFDDERRPQFCADYHCAYLRGETNVRPNESRNTFLDVVLSGGRPHFLPQPLAVVGDE